MTGRILKDEMREQPRRRACEMARGFESKDVEFQQEEAARRARTGVAASPDERARQVTRRTAELALTRARAELAQTTSPVRRDALARAIAQLETQVGVAADPDR